MKCGVLTVGTVPVPLPLDGRVLTEGVRLLGRAGNSGSVYVGFAQGVTTTNGVLLAKGAPGVTIPFTVPPDHFASGELWLVSDTAGQTVEWAAA